MWKSYHACQKVYAEEVTPIIEKTQNQSQLSGRDENVALVMQHLIYLASASVLNTLPLETVMRKVLLEALKLTEATHGGIYLHDTDSNRLILQSPYFGMSASTAAQVRPPVDESTLVGRVFLTGRSYRSSRVAGNPIINQSDVKRVQDHEGLLYRNIICVPLTLEQHRLGVLELTDRHQGDFSATDEYRLGTIGPAIAGVLHNWQYLKEMQSRLSLLGAKTAAIERLSCSLEQGDDLSLVIANISHLLSGNPIMVQDRYHQSVLDAPQAAFPQDLQAEISGALRTERVRKVLSESEKTCLPSRLALAAHGLASHDFIVAPLRVGELTAGWLWTLAKSSPLNQDAFWLLKQWAPVVARMLLAQERSSNSKGIQINHFLDALTTGNSESSLTINAMARRLGHNLREPHHLLLIVPDDKEITTEHVHRTLNSHGERELRLGSLAMTTEGHLLLVSSALDKTAAELTRKVQQLLRRLEPGLTVSGIHSRPATTPDEYRTEFKKMTHCLPILRRTTKREQILCYYNPGLEGLLMNLRDPEIIEYFCNKTLGDLIAHGNIELIESLQAYLDNDGHLEKTARILHVHVNTLRRRLTKISELTKADLRNSENKARLMLAMRALPLLNNRQDYNRSD